MARKGRTVTEQNTEQLSTQYKKAIEAMMGQAAKKYGEGAIFMMGENHVENMPRFSSGSIAIDDAMGGGYPVGRIVEIFGPESSGKTTLALHAVASAQKEFPEKVVLYLDVEHALDPTYAANIGVDMNRVLLSQPGSGEQALDIAEMAINSSGAVSLIVIDSVAALVPQAEIDGDMGDSHVGLQARLMSQALRKLTGAAYNSKCTIIFINQLREKIGIMFGNPETTTGGRALKFYSSVRIEVRGVDWVKKDGSPSGRITRAKVVKNKTAVPFRETKFEIEFGKGISAEGDILDFALDKGVVERSGSWYSYKGMKIGQGRDKAKQYLAENRDVMDEISEDARAACGWNAAGTAHTPDATENDGYEEDGEYDDVIDSDSVSDALFGGGEES